MKPKMAVLVVIILSCALILSGCSNTPATTVVTAMTDTPASPTATATIEPSSTPEPSPTPVPPIPCSIVFESNRDGNQEIYRMNPDGSGQTNLSNDGAEDINPVWSPDGSQVAFVSKRETSEEGVQNIFVVNADGSNLRQLTHHFYADWPSWSHDGRRITYTDGIDILIMNADGSGEPINLTHDEVKDTRPTWSPDGTKIAWSSGDDGQWNLFVMDADGSNKKQITDNGQVFGATWTIDGRLLTNWGW